MPASVLVLEDDLILRQIIKRHLTRKGYSIVECGTIEQARRAIADPEQHFDLFLTDVGLPDGDGLEFLAEIDRSAMRIVVMTADDRIDNPIEALRLGATDFLLKPFEISILDHTVTRALERSGAIDELTSSKEATSTEGGPTDVVQTAPLDAANEWRARFASEMLGHDPALHEVMRVLERIADTDCPVLITGESGTGKELIARAVHAGSNRRSRAFIAVNCAAIPENLIESELFGHSRGAFTGAVTARSGHFASADGGTLFLDEIGELAIGVQAKLLRALQQREITPVGESKPVHVDVRIVAATNRNLEAMVIERKFREDLLYRLNVIAVELPPLRERRGDIADLLHHFILRTNARRNRQVTGIDEEAVQALSRWSWPGNIRELENVVERMVLLRATGHITLEDVPAKMRAVTASAAPVSTSMGQPVLPEEGIDLRSAVEQFENSLITQALERAGWNKNRAAQFLHMNRTTLVERLKKKGIEVPAGATD